MEQRVTTYQISVANKKEMANQIIQNYLQAHGYSFIQKDNKSYYQSKDMMTGAKGFSYYFTQTEVILQVWIGNFYPIDTNTMNVNASSYRNELVPLLQELGNLNNDMTTTNNFTKNVEEKNEKVCMIGFILSICGFILALLDVTYGVFVYILVFYFASLGLKTKKKNIAILSIVFAILSIIIVILKLIKG